MRRIGFGAWMALLVVLALLGPAIAPHAPAAAPRAFSRYEIDARLEPGVGAINATMTLDWVNDTGEPQASVFFRVYPNAGYYGDGALTLLETSVDGAPVSPAVPADPTVLEVPLPAAVGPGARATIAFAFQTAVPSVAPDGLGIFQHDARGVWSLANWYPIVAGYEPGQGWYLEPPTIFGDPTFSDTADYHVRFRTPAGYTVVGSGAETTTPDPDGGLVTELRAPLAREFALTVLPGGAGGEIVSRSVQAGGTELTLTLPKDLAIPGVEETILETAADALPVYAGWFGDDPGGNLDFTTVDLTGASAVSFAGTMWLDIDSIAGDQELSEIERIRLRFIVLHELGHQWISNIIGANTNDHQFMSEGLVNMLVVAAVNDVYGPAEAERYLRADVAGAYQALVRDGRDGVADTAVSNELNGVLHSIFVYGKAAVGFEAIRQEIGSEVFFSAMGAYGREFRFGIATPDDLRRVLEESSGEDLDALWVFWFEDKGATIADVDAVLDGYAATAGG
ncbi:MAG TPA: M1 family aminopeptidase [Thermomicrobiales bacterium]|nr:M1 family aminopeptidase [Thermomicrobiales bacterium]